MNQIEFFKGVKIDGVNYPILANSLKHHKVADSDTLQFTFDIPSTFQSTSPAYNLSQLEVGTLTICKHSGNMDYKIKSFSMLLGEQNSFGERSTCYVIVEAAFLNLGVKQ